MLLYMFALQQHGQSLLGENPVPVGVQYFPARAPMVSSDGRLTEEQVRAERGKGMKRRGLVLSDSDVLNAMEPDDAPKRLSCKRNKDGTVTGDVADRDQLKLLKGYVFHTLKKIVDDISSGDVTPNPYTRGSAHDACGYCPYQQVCHFATVEGRRNYKAMSAQEFWDQIGKEMKGNG
jgi:ATP-dependent helicase/nuclease subunit B